MTRMQPSLPLSAPSWRPLALVAGLALAASATSLANGFAYDDVHLVLRNDRVHDLGRLPMLFLESYWPPVPLGEGGRLYRPLTTAAFAIQWALGGGHPIVFHLASVLLTILVSLLVLGFARRLLPPGPATLTAALFAVHPAHTEVVGNVVGQGELLAATWCLLGAILILDGRRAGWSHTRYAAVGLVTGLALLSKEHALVLLLLAPLLVLAVGGVRALAAESTGRLVLILTAIALVYLSLRSSVLGSVVGDLPHPLWRGLPTQDRLLTMLGVVPTWLRLMLWPAELRADYAPRQVELVTAMTGRVWLGLAILGGLLLLALLSRRTPALWLGILWAAVTALPTANFLVPTGIVLAERTLFLPSVGICLACGAGAAWVGRGGNRPEALRLGFGTVCLALLALGVLGSARRLPVWRDSQTLFAQTVRDAPRSYWAWRNQAGSLVLQGRELEAIEAYRRSLELFDRDPTVYDDLAGVERRLGRCGRAVPLLREALRLDPERHQTAARLVGCLTTLAEWDAARQVARERVARGRDEFRRLMAMVDSTQQAAQLPTNPHP
jgi:hypothetical protein